MKKWTLFLMTLLCLNYLNAQEFIKEITTLSAKVEETSGLIYVDRQLYTMNDSGGKAELYAIDSATGEVLRTIEIDEAKNVDWESLDFDEEYVYIADMGNNAGARENLRIYRIKRAKLKDNNKINATTIKFEFEDQTSFFPSSKNNFDAEALTTTDYGITVFSKNRGDGQSKVYKVLNQEKKHPAKKLFAHNVGGLITGATKNLETGEIVLCGYGEALSPFLIIFSDINETDFVKIDLASVIGLGNQIEGITHKEGATYYISREQVKKKVGSFSVHIKPALFEFNRDQIPDNTKVVQSFTTAFKEGNINQINSSEIQEVRLYTLDGKMVHKQMDSLSNLNELQVENGFYNLHLKLSETQSVSKKIEWLKNK